MRKSRVAIIGAGALGLMYGSALSLVPEVCSVSYIVDSERADRYSAGFVVNSRPFFPSCTVIGSSAAPFDIVIFAVKATALDSAIRAAANFIDSHTILLSLLNGVTSELALEKAFEPANVVYCVAQGMDATRMGNILTYGHMGQIRMGIPAGRAEKQHALDFLDGFLTDAGIPHLVEEDIMHRMWSKLMLNVGINQVCMTREGGYGIVHTPGPARDEMIAAMREVVIAAACEGITITEKDLIGYVELIDGLDPDGMPSMRQDGLAHRKTEVDLFAGTICRMANTYGFEAPVNRRLLEKIREMEADYR